MNPSNSPTPSPAQTLRSAAILAGMGLLIMAILAPIAEFGVFQKLIATGDAKTTTDNISSSAALFRLATCGFLIVAMLDVLVAWALYILLKPADAALSLLAACFRLVFSGMFAIALTDLFSVSQLLSGSQRFKMLPAQQLEAQVMLHLDTFRQGWDIALAFFGLHLAVLGYVTFKSGYVPKFLGLMLIVAGMGYLTDSFGKLLLPSYSVAITEVTFIGEVLLMFWLLWKGIKGFAPVLHKHSV